MVARQSWVFKAQVHLGTNRNPRGKIVLQLAWLCDKCQVSCRSVGHMTCMHAYVRCLVFSRATKPYECFRAQQWELVSSFQSCCFLRNWIYHLSTTILLPVCIIDSWSILVVFSMAYHCIVPQSTPYSHLSFSSGWSMQRLWKPITWYAHGWMGWERIWCALAGYFGDIWLLWIGDMEYDM